MAGTFLASLALFVSGSQVSSADVVGLKNGKTIRGTVANRSELSTSLRTLATISILPDSAVVDTSGATLIRLPRNEVDYIVIEEGEQKTVLDLAGTEAQAQPLEHRRLNSISSIRAPLGAASQSGSVTARPWLLLSLIGSTYTMSDLDDVISRANAAEGPGGLQMNLVTSGLGFGASGGIDLSDGISLGVGVDRLLAGSEIHDATGSVELHLPVNMFRGFGTYAFSREKMDLARVGLSIGRISSAGDVTISEVAIGSDKGKLSGTSILWEGFVGGDLFSESMARVSWAAGYRRGVLPDVTVAGYNWYSLDYSGVFVRAGLKFMLTR